MKERFKNWRTTIIAIPVLAYGLFMIGCVICNSITKCCPECAYKPMDIIPVLGLGWAFLTAKDTLIEGITLGLLKPKA